MITQPHEQPTGHSLLIIVHKGDLVASMVLEGTARILVPGYVINLISTIVIPVYRAGCIEVNQIQVPSCLIHVLLHIQLL